MLTPPQLFTLFPAGFSHIYNIISRMDGTPWTSPSPFLVSPRPGSGRGSGYGGNGSGGGAPLVGSLEPIETASSGIPTTFRV